MTSITNQRALAPFRKDPAHLVQNLPGRRVSWGWVGHAVAVLAGFVVAILALAVEGSL